MLPKDVEYFFTKANIPRALDAGELAEKAKQYGLTGSVVPKVTDALKSAKAKAEAPDMIFVGGSTFVVAEVIIM